MTNEKIIIGVLIVLFLVMGVIAFGFYVQMNEAKNSLNVAKQNDPQKVSENEALAIIDEVGKLIVLPEDEKPVIATVADPEKLKGQLFFAKAKVGDRVLIYPNAAKAILYDPVAKKILEVAPLNIGSPQAQGTANGQAVDIMQDQNEPVNP